MSSADIAYDGAMHLLRPTYTRDEILRYAEAFVAGTTEQNFGLIISISAGGRRQSQTATNSYVYCWCDPDDNVFYIGKGHGDRAWNKDGHDYALRYVESFLGGRYSVHLLLEHLADSQASDVEEALIGRFGNALANWVNPCLLNHLPPKALDEQGALPRPNRSAYRGELQTLLRTHPPGLARLEALQSLLDRLRRADTAEEQADRAEALELQHISLLHRMRLRLPDLRLNAMQAEIVARVVSELWRLRRYQELVDTVDGFRAAYPDQFTDSRATGVRVATRDLAVLKKRNEALARVVP